ncbi:RHS repeat-associated core domain-containing protein [Gorillibacterium sp. sgz5001074]|uniref:RHS repeat-associated core domain-containing protein n=1 Tax=Gorillibacterium sp. sgz5001074 TaxID=3446695 RepID=UPI003F6646FA
MIYDSSLSFKKIVLGCLIFFMLLLIQVNNTVSAAEQTFENGDRLSWFNPDDYDTFLVSPSGRLTKEVVTRWVSEQESKGRIVWVLTCVGKRTGNSIGFYSTATDLRPTVEITSNDDATVSFNQSSLQLKSDGSSYSLSSKIGLSTINLPSSILITKLDERANIPGHKIRFMNNTTFLESSTMFHQTLAPSDLLFSHENTYGFDIHLNGTLIKSERYSSPQSGEEILSRSLFENKLRYESWNNFILITWYHESGEVSCTTYRFTHMFPEKRISWFNPDDYESHPAFIFPSYRLTKQMVIEWISEEEAKGMKLWVITAQDIKSGFNQVMFFATPTDIMPTIKNYTNRVTVFFDQLVSEPRNDGTNFYNYVLNRGNPLTIGLDSYPSTVLITSFNERSALPTLTGKTSIGKLRKVNPYRFDLASFLADPINMSTGAHVIEKTYFQQNGVNSNISLSLHYDSLLLARGPLGRGWTHNYETKLVSQADGSIILQWNSNRTNTFTPVGKNQFESRDKEVRFDVLMRNSDSTYTLSRSDQSQYLFDAAGKLVTYKNKQAQVLNLEYETNGQLKKVVETISGAYLSYAYNGNGLINSVTDNTNRSVVFTYDANQNMVQLKEPAGSSTYYTYNADGRVLTGKDDEGVNLFNNAYDFFGRVVEQVDANSNMTRMQYDEQSENGYLITTVTDRANAVRKIKHDSNYNIVEDVDNLGRSTTYTYDSFGNRITESDANGHTTTMTYDALGNLLTQTNPAGETTTMTYDERNNLLTVTNPAGQSIMNTYDEWNNLTSTTDPMGNTTVYKYDSNNLLLTKIAADGAVTAYSYSNGRMKGMTDPEGNTTTYSYDAAGRLAASKDPMGNTTTYAYDGNDRLLETTDPLGNKTRFTYNSHGEILTKTDAMGNVTTYEYNGNGKRTRSTDPLGNTTHYEYDAEDRLARITDPLGYITKKVYDAKGRLIHTVDALGNVTSIEYDPANQPIRHVNPDGSATTSEYDAAGRLTKRTDSLGQTSQYQYNNAGKIIRETNPLLQENIYSYDENGNVLAKTEPGGVTNRYIYDQAGRIVSKMDALNHTISYTYNKNGKITAMTNSEGATTYYQYDANSQLVKVIDAEGQVTSYEYDAKGRLILTVESDGGQVRLQYDALDRLIRRTDAEGYSETYTYDANGHHLTTTDAAGQVTRMNYDANGRLLGILDPNGASTTYTYDAIGQVLSQTDANGNTTLYEYDMNGRRTTVVDALGNRTSYTYDSVGRLLGIKDPMGSVTSFQYDALGRVIGTKDALDHETSLTFDSAGHEVSRTDASGHITSTVHDLLGRQTSVTDPLGNTNRFEYNGLGQLTHHWDPEGRHSERVYDNLQRLVQVKDPMGQISLQTYDSLGNVASLTDPNQNKTTYHYDRNKLLRKETNSAGQTIQYEYQARGLLASSTNSRGQITQYKYDNGGRLIGFTDPTGTVSYGYDPNGNVTTIRENAGVITRQYDALNRVISYTDERGNTIRYEYDAAGQLITLTYPDGKQVHYTYDATGSMTTVTDWQNRLTSYSYDENQRLIRTIRPDGSVEYREYDAAGQLVVLRDKTVNDLVLQEFTFTYNGSGDVLQEQEQSYIYDLNGRLIGNSTERYTYDAGGNMTVSSATYGTRSMTYGPDNQLVNIDGIQVIYDADGNLLEAPLKGSRTTFVYDSRNRLIEAGGISYSYDAENKRSTVTDATYGTTRYVINPHAGLSQVLMEIGEDGKPKAYNIYGIGLIGREDAAGSYSVYHFDRRGSTTVLTDVYGAITDRYGYDSYGELIIKEGSTINPFLYNGRDGVITDPNGLYYMRTRYYSPELKRFLNRDVVTGSIENSQSINRFSYVQGNPISNVDPLGLSPLDSSVLAQLNLAKVDYAFLFNNSSLNGFPIEKKFLVLQIIKGKGKLTGDDLIRLGMASEDKGNWFVRLFKSNSADNFASLLEASYRANKMDSSLEEYSWEDQKRHFAELSGLFGAVSFGKDTGTRSKPVSEGPGKDVKATEMPVITKGSKEWDNAVTKLKDGGSSNFRVESASDAKALMQEGRGNMNRYKQYSTKKYDKGYERHPNESHTQNAPHNDLPHIKWKDWHSNNTGKGHIFYTKPN